MNALLLTLKYATTLNGKKAKNESVFLRREAVHSMSLLPEINDKRKLES